MNRIGATALIAVWTLSIPVQANDSVRLADLSIQTKLNEIPADTVFDVTLSKDIQSWSLNHEGGGLYSREFYFMSGSPQKREPNRLKTYCSLKIERESFNQVPSELRLIVVNSDVQTLRNAPGYVLGATLQLNSIGHREVQDGVLRASLSCNAGFNQSFRGSLRIKNLLHAFGSALSP